MSAAAVGRGQEDVRRHNLAAVLQLVHREGPTTRARLTQHLGLNRSTVGDLVGGLAAAGLVTEEEPHPSAPRGAGRPSLVVRPRADDACVVAVHVDVHRLHVARVALGGRVLRRRSAAMAPGTSPQTAARRAASLVAAMFPGDADSIVGIGVAVPGTVGLADGVVGLAPNLGWAQVPLGEIVARAVASRLGVEPPVVVANDANAGALAEHLRGAGRGSDDVVYLCGTWGLGGGLITGGRPLAGRRGHAGEVGHLNVDPAGRPCHCGSRGCWEAEALAGAWADALQLDAEAPDIADQVLARLASGGVAARRTRDRVSRSFARGLAGVVNVVDADVVVLGAGLWARLWPEVEVDVQPWLRRMVLPALRDAVEIRTASLGEDSTLLGCAELAFADLLRDPVPQVSARLLRA